jgi:hypothetical protein
LNRFQRDALPCRLGRRSWQVGCGGHGSNISSGVATIVERTPGGHHAATHPIPMLVLLESFVKPAYRLACVSMGPPRRIVPLHRGRRIQSRPTRQPGGSVQIAKYIASGTFALARNYFLDLILIAPDLLYLQHNPKKFTEPYDVKAYFLPEDGWSFQTS